MIPFIAAAIAIGVGALVSGCNSSREEELEKALADEKLKNEIDEQLKPSWCDNVEAPLPEGEKYTLSLAQAENDCSVPPKATGFLRDTLFFTCSQRSFFSGRHREAQTILRSLKINSEEPAIRKLALEQYAMNLSATLYCGEDFNGDLLNMDYGFNYLSRDTETEGLTTPPPISL